MVSTTLRPNFGTGVYSFPAAARLIKGASSRQLQYWMRTGLAPASFGRGTEGSSVLSFHDLISLEIVRRFKVAGLSLQKIRKLEVELRRELSPDLERPFASESFFTDGATVWFQRHPEDEAVIEIVGRRSGRNARQHSWTEVVRSFAQEIRYEGGVAAEWELSRYFHVDPEVQYGAPVVRGTRVTVDAIRSSLEGGSPAEVARWFRIPIGAIREARDFAD